MLVLHFFRRELCPVEGKVSGGRRNVRASYLKSHSKCDPEEPFNILSKPASFVYADLHKHWLSDGLSISCGTSVQQANITCETNCTSELCNQQCIKTTKLKILVAFQIYFTVYFCIDDLTQRMRIHATSISLNKDIQVYVINDSSLGWISRGNNTADENCL